MRMWVAVAAAAGVLTSGCSSRPREFRAKLATSAATPDRFEQDLTLCQVLVRKGVRGNFKTTAAQVGTGAVVGTLGAAAVGTIAASSAASAGSGFNILAGSGIGAASTALPIIGTAAAFGMSRIIRSGREKKYKAALGMCMTEYGYAVEGWEVQKRLTKAAVAEALESQKEAAPAEPTAAAEVQP